MSLVYVSATIYPKQGSEAALEQELRNLMEEVRAEDGCIRYDLHASEDRSMYYFYEIWRDKPALDAHAVSPHIEAMRKSTEAMVAKPAEVQVWGAVDVLE